MTHQTAIVIGSGIGGIACGIRLQSLGFDTTIEPRLMQTAFFRPHNRSEDVANLYLVGQGTQPGGGTPSVMMSAKMTAREIARDFAIDLKGAAGPSHVKLGWST